MQTIHTSFNISKCSQYTLPIFCVLCIQFLMYSCVYSVQSTMKVKRIKMKKKLKWNENLQFALCSMFNVQSCEIRFCDTFHFSPIEMKISRADSSKQWDTIVHSCFVSFNAEMMTKLLAGMMRRKNTQTAPHTVSEWWLWYRGFDHIAKMSSTQIEIIFNTA